MGRALAAAMGQSGNGSSWAGKRRLDSRQSVQPVVAGDPGAVRHLWACYLCTDIRAREEVAHLAALDYHRHETMGDYHGTHAGDVHDHISTDRNVGALWSVGLEC